MHRWETLLIRAAPSPILKATRVPAGKVVETLSILFSGGKL